MHRLSIDETFTRLPIPDSSSIITVSHLKTLGVMTCQEMNVPTGSYTHAHRNYESHEAHQSLAMRSQMIYHDQASTCEGAIKSSRSWELHIDVASYPFDNQPPSNHGPFTKIFENA